MSAMMEEEIKRWTARRKAALVLEIIQGKTTVSEASREFDLTPSEGLSRQERHENALKASRRMFGNNTNVSSRHCRRPMARRCRSCVPEKNGSPCWARTRHDRSHPPGTERRRFEVSIARLCAWFGIARRTVYYRARRSPPKVQNRFAEPIKA